MNSSREAINTPNAPAAIGTYSQAIRSGNQLYISGQIPLDPATGVLKNSTIEEEIHQAFQNLKAVAEAGGGNLNQSIKVGIYLTDLSHFATLNSIMAQYFDEPYPARAAIEVKGLPKGARVEMDAVIAL